MRRKLRSKLLILTAVLVLGAAVGYWVFTDTIETTGNARGTVAKADCGNHIIETGETCDGIVACPEGSTGVARCTDTCGIDVSGCAPLTDQGCVDTDGGENPNLAGTATATANGQPTEIRIDSCSTERILIEYHCNGIDAIERLPVSCPLGCSAGRCV